MRPWTWIAIGIAPAAIAWVAILALSRSGLAKRLADHPNERSLHAIPTPRIGGLGVMAAALPIAAAFATPDVDVILGAAMFLCLMSLVDDFRSLPIQVRLPGHFAAATIALLAVASPGAGQTQIGVAGFAVALLALVWMTNLFNFMDGSDGLAGGMAAFGFAAFALAAALAARLPLAAVALVLASASLGFLAHNFPPARVFLGDAGSVPLGFLAGALGLQGWMTGAWPLFFPVLVFAPFIVDASLTLAVRIAKGETVWKAHRTHLYQRLVLRGWTRRRLLFAAYPLMAVSGLAALAAREADGALQSGIILVFAVVYLLLFIAAGSRVRVS